MNIVALLQDSFRRLKANPIILVPMLASTVVIALLSLILVGSLVPKFGPMQSQVVIDANEAIGMAGMALGRLIAILIVGSIVSLLTHGMTVMMADDALHDRPVKLGTAWEQTKPRLIPLVIASVVVGLLVSIGLMILVLPGVVVAFFLMFTFAALMVNQLAPFNAIGNSFKTVKGNFGSTFVFFLVMIALGVLVGVINFVLGLIPVLGPILSVIVGSAYASFLSVFVVAVYRGLTEVTDAPPQPEA